MAEKITQVQVGKNRIGLRGLEAVFLALRGRQWTSPEEAQEELMSRVAAENYLPPGSRAAYKKALWREFRRFRGEAVEEEAPGALEVTVLGLGCAACQGFYQMVVDTLAAMGLEAGLNYVTDPAILKDYGVRPLPALLVNGRVAAAGRVPSPAEIKDILAAARQGGVGSEKA
jgi:hypothetical protein